MKEPNSCEGVAKAQDNTPKKKNPVHNKDDASD